MSAVLADRNAVREVARRTATSARRERRRWFWHGGQVAGNSTAAQEAPKCDRHTV